MGSMTYPTGPLVVPTPEQEFPDFTKPREPYRFRLGGKDYAAPPIISMITLRRVQTLAKSWNETQNADNADPLAGVKAVADCFALLVPGQGGQEIAARIMSEDDPVDLQAELLPCFYWLIGKYVPNRPTQPSPGSSNGSITPSGDTSSTDGASAEESTSTT